MKRIAGTFAVALLVVVLGCVIRTEHKIDAHITLDIRHVEEEVGGVFDYVTGAAKEMPEIAAEGAEQETEPEAAEDAPEKKGAAWLRRLGDALSPIQVAYAKEEETSPLVKEIAESMKKRYPELAKAKTSGFIGENNKGYVELRDSDALKGDAEKDALKKKVQELVDGENKDRKALYKEMARLKKLDVAVLEAVGAKDQLKRAKKGEWVQLPEAGKDFDELKASELGKKLGDKCKAAAWVQMP